MYYNRHKPGRPSRRNREALERGAAPRHSGDSHYQQGHERREADSVPRVFNDRTDRSALTAPSDRSRHDTYRPSYRYEDSPDRRQNDRGYDERRSDRWAQDSYRPSYSASRRNSSRDRDIPGLRYRQRSPKPAYRSGRYDRSPDRSYSNRSNNGRDGFTDSLYSGYDDRRELRGRHEHGSREPPRRTPVRSRSPFRNSYTGCVKDTRDGEAVISGHKMDAERQHSSERRRAPSPSGDHVLASRDTDGSDPSPTREPSPSHRRNSLPGATVSDVQLEVHTVAPERKDLTGSTMPMSQHTDSVGENPGTVPAEDEGSVVQHVSASINDAMAGLTDLPPATVREDSISGQDASEDSYMPLCGDEDVVDAILPSEDADQFAGNSAEPGFEEAVQDTCSPVASPKAGVPADAKPATIDSILQGFRDKLDLAPLQGMIRDYTSKTHEMIGFARSLQPPPLSSIWKPDYDRVLKRLVPGYEPSNSGQSWDGRSATSSSDLQRTTGNDRFSSVDSGSTNSASKDPVLSGAGSRQQPIDLDDWDSTLVNLETTKRSRAAVEREKNRLQKKLRKGSDSFAPALFEILEHFEVHNSAQQQAHGDEWTQNQDSRFMLPFPAGSALLPMSLTEWLSIQPGEWYTDNTLSNAVYIDSANAQPSTHFCDPTTTWNWLPDGRRLEQKIQVLEEAVKAAKSTGTTGPRGYPWPAEDMPGDTNLLMFIWNSGAHWVAVEVVPDLLTFKGTITVYDSLPYSGRMKAATLLLPLFATLISLRPGVSWGTQSWELKKGNATRQMNWTDCGPLAAYVCKMRLRLEQPRVVLGARQIDAFGEELRHELLRTAFRSMLGRPLPRTKQHPLAKLTLTCKAPRRPAVVRQSSPLKKVVNVSDLDVNAADATDDELDPCPFVDAVTSATSNGQFNYREALCNALDSSESLGLERIQTIVEQSLGSRSLGEDEDANHDTLRERVTLLMCNTATMFELSPPDLEEWRLVSERACSVSSAQQKSLLLEARPGKISSDSDHNHVRFEVTISCIRTSGYEKLETALLNRDERPAQLLAAHHRRFGKTPALPTEFDETADLIEYPTWTPYFKEARSSREYFLKGNRAADQRVQDLLAAADDDAGRRGRLFEVLLLGAGHDGLSTNNAGWGILNSTYENLRFSIGLAIDSDTVPRGQYWHVDAGYAWALYKVDILAAVWERKSETLDLFSAAVRKHHEQFVLICQLIDCYKADCSFANQKRYFTIDIRPSSENPAAIALTASGRNNIPFESLDSKACQKCGSSTTRCWVRGSPRQDLGWLCSECLSRRNEPSSRQEPVSNASATDTEPDSSFAPRRGALSKGADRKAVRKRFSIVALRQCKESSAVDSAIFAAKDTILRDALWSAAEKERARECSVSQATQQHPLFDDIEHDQDAPGEWEDNVTDNASSIEQSPSEWSGRQATPIQTVEPFVDPDELMLAAESDEDELDFEVPAEDELMDEAM